MTALPVQHPHLLTADEYAALPEDTEVRYELQEGALVMSPKPIPRHQSCLGELQYQLRNQVPRHLKILVDVDVDLGLVHPTKPGFVRAPDLVVVARAAFHRVDRDGGLLRASEVGLAVEIISRGSVRMDTVIKHGEYADAGIPHYWVIDPSAPVSLVACHLGGELGYVDAPAATGVFTTEAPFPVRLDLDELV